MKKTETYRISGNIKIRDLRELVEATKDFPDDSVVNIEGRREYNQFDWDEQYIEVSS